MSEREARQWPDLMKIIEEKVKPARMGLGENPDARRRKANWWLYGRYTPGLFNAIRGLDRVLAIAFTSRTLAFTHQPSDRIFEHSVVVFPNGSFSFFGLLQSRVHEVWARFFGSTMKDDSCYTPSACFQTFPFPLGFEKLVSLELTARAYYEFRGNLMLNSGQGLTATYNRFNNPDDDNSDMLRLRELHADLDRAVLDAYGWAEIKPACKYIPEFESEDEDDENGGQRNKRYRYRWPDEIHDEVLARLLDLNRQRALDEGQVVTDERAAALDTTVKKPSKRKTKAEPAEQGSTANLFLMDQEKE
jgi:hypothetical protein